MGEVDPNKDIVHPPSLTQQNPWVISYLVTSGTSWIASNGWFILFFLLFCYIFWHYTKAKFQQWQKRQEEFKELAQYHKDPDKVLARERALDSARLRMQEQYNLQVQKQEEQRREREEKRRREYLEDWERHKRGEGYRSKTGKAPATESSAENNKPSGKPKLRPEYNPMTGDAGGGACGWRPSRNNASRGG
ncbi:selenoprotein S-like isoform X1 [Procambarus clarkii]|uniref:selenoprotein S-like isoform X1 n=1 Tax=Procambarus clarkii TaxID=6728 RepID=UPI003742109C